MPDAAVDPVNAQLAMNGILSLADRVYLEQPYDEVNAKPFVAEHMGGYSYSRSSYGSKLLVGIQAGQPTGVFWFDTASTRLGVCKLAIKGATGGIQVDFNTRDGSLGCETTTDGFSTSRKFYGPDERNLFDFPLLGAIPEWWYPNWWRWEN